MPKSYHHLSKEKRSLLYILVSRADPIELIVNELEVHRSTNYREVNRNNGRGGYCYKQAQEMAVKRQGYKRRRKKLSDNMIALIEKKLNIQWSPEQISGWMKKQGGLLYKHHRNRE